MTSPHVWIIDNYDSFTYNLVQLFGKLRCKITVSYHDTVSLTDIEAGNPTHLCISPGPGNPNDAGISLATIEHFKKSLPILGVCLGMQCIVQASGGTITHAQKPMHGKISPVYFQNDPLFWGCSNPFNAMRYHSLIAKNDSLGSNILSIAETMEGEVMAVRHKYLPLVGVQFHPESIISEYGEIIIQNFLKTPFPRF